MVVTRSGEAGCLVLATCALFDTRVFLVSRGPWAGVEQLAQSCLQLDLLHTPACASSAQLVHNKRHSRCCVPLSV